MKIWRIVSFASIVALASMGCSSTLETGYMPRKLGASDDVRRGYYASPFTPEAKAAKQFQVDYDDSHVRPNF